MGFTARCFDKTNGRVGGAAQHPAWYLNLCDEPRVTIVMEGRESATFRW